LSKYQKITEEQIVEIQDRLQKGESVRKIARECLGSESRESTLRSKINKGFFNTITEDLIEDVEDELTPDVLDELCSSSTWELSNLAKRLRNAQRANSQLRKIQNGVFDASEGESVKTLDQVLEGVIGTVNKAPEVTLHNNSGGEGAKITAEVIISDIQYGKLMHKYNTEVAVKRVKHYAQEVIKGITEKINQGYVFDKIILAILGDIIESDKKHINSGRACDTGTAEQMKTALENIFLDLVEPLALLGIPVEVVSITGNHDHDQHGLNMFMPGAQHLSWSLYHSLRMLTEAKGYDHVAHEIPTGCYTVKDIYGFNTLYEHGVGVSTSEAAMTKRMTQRGEQTRKHIDYFRMGDKHNITRFNLDTKVVNGSFFGNGDDIGGGEYSAIVGYCSEPAQITLFHTPRKKGDTRTSIFDSLLVQLGHIR
jgi:hypothetical protein